MRQLVVDRPDGFFVDGLGRDMAGIEEVIEQLGDLLVSAELVEELEGLEIGRDAEGVEADLLLARFLAEELPVPVDAQDPQGLEVVHAQGPPAAQRREVDDDALERVLL